MSVLSSIDTSQHTTPLSLLQLGNDKFSTTAKDIDKYAKLETPNVAALDPETPKVDLNNYYSNVQATALNTDVLSDVAQAEQNFSDAVVNAVANGLDPQSAVNIQTAKAAYAASVKVAEVANSTFELLI